MTNDKDLMSKKIVTLKKSENKQKLHLLGLGKRPKATVQSKV